MKNYNEMTNDVFRRIDEYNAKQKQKKKLAVRTAAALVCVCLAVLAGIGIRQGGLLSTKPKSKAETEGNILPSESKSEYPNLALLSFSQWQCEENVVWGSGTPTKGKIPAEAVGEAGKAVITSELKSALSSGGKNTVYAVMVDFTPTASKSLLIEGKTAAELKEEIKALTAQGKNSEAKEIAQKINDAAQSSYFEQIKKFRAEFASMGLGVYHEEYGCTIDNCIFYTFATREQIENFECAPDEAFIFSSAVRLK